MTDPVPSPEPPGDHTDPAPAVAPDRTLVDELRAASVVDQAVIVALRSESVLDRSSIDQLQRALIAARRIGAAVGILMATHKISDQAAFALLSTASQHRNQKLRDVAEDVLLTGTLQVHDQLAHVVHLGQHGQLGEPDRLGPSWA